MKAFCVVLGTYQPVSKAILTDHPLWRDGTAMKITLTDLYNAVYFIYILYIFISYNTLPYIDIMPFARLYLQKNK